MRIKLVNPPPASLKWPSIGLTQLKGRLLDQFSVQDVSVEIEYLNFPFAEFVGMEPYDLFTRSRLGKGYAYLEWFFQEVAFPDSRNTQADFFEVEGLQYLRAFSPHEAEENRKKIRWANQLLVKRRFLESFIDQTLLDYGLLEADVVGFSSMFNQNLPILAFARRIKYFRPQTLILIGGCNCESPMGEEMVKNFEVIDYVFSGPSLISFPRFIESYLKGDLESLNRINGVFSSQNLHRIAAPFEKVNPRETIRALGDELPLNEFVELDYQDFLETRKNFQKYELPEAGLFFESSRGCWWGEKAHCTFCGLNAGSMKYQQSSCNAAKDQIERLVNSHGKDVKYFAAVDNIMPQSFPQDVFPELELKHDVDIFYEVKSDLSYAELKSMKRAGVASIQPGIEALDSELLKLMKKGVTSTRNIQFLKDTTSLEMNVLWNILIGFPGESEDSYRQLEKMIPLLTHLHPPNLFGGVVFCRYSPYHSWPESYGLHLAPSRGMKLMYPDIAESSLHKMAYFFEDTSPKPGYLENRRKWFPRLNPLVLYWRSRWYGGEHQSLPELYFLPDRTKICDTRSEGEIWLPIDSREDAVLSFLNMPRSIGKIRNRFGHLSDIDRILEGLIVRGLIFHDQRKTFISLVFDKALRRSKPSQEYSFY